MADDRVRQIEREVKAAQARGRCTPEMMAALASEQIRAGARDPRLDPRKGDWLVGKSERDVVSVWPRALTRDECVFSDDGARLSAPNLEPIWLPVGTPIDRVLDGPASWVAGLTERIESPRDLFFLALLGGEWQRFRCYSHASIGEEDGWLPLAEGPCAPATRVTFRETRGRSLRNPLVTVSIDLWRKWARTVIVRRIAA